MLLQALCKSCKPQALLQPSLPSAMEDVLPLNTPAGGEHSMGSGSDTVPFTSKWKNDSIIDG